MKKFIDRVQVWLYLAGFMWLAYVIGKWGTQPKGALPQLASETDITLDEVELDDDDIYERETLPEFGVPKGREHLEGPGWRLDEFPPEPLRVIEFDATFNTPNRGIDLSRDIAPPTSRLVVN